MNKIVIENDSIQTKSLSDAITLEQTEKSMLFTVNTLKLNIRKNCKLDLSFYMKEASKMNIEITVGANVNFQMMEYREGEKLKIQYRYILKEGARVNVQKFSLLHHAREFDIVDFVGDGAQFDLKQKTLARGDEKYNLALYHKVPNTVSRIEQHGVAIKDGKLVFQLTGVVDIGAHDVVMNADGCIYVTEKQDCEIKPNFVLDEIGTEETHHVKIETIKESESFDEKTEKECEFACRFLLDGCRFSKAKEKKYKEQIRQYWG